MRSLGNFLFLFSLLFVGAARAQKPELFAQYEEQLISKTLAKRGVRIDPAPDGKRIAAIYLAGHDIILPGDMPLHTKLPWTILNRAHMRTRDQVVARELLISVGALYQRDLVEESERNLRNLFILSVARILPVEISGTNQVALLVITKDRWTLRLNTSFLIDSARIDVLSMSIAESNLLGRNKRFSIEFNLDPGRFAFGTSYTDPRLFASRHSLFFYALLFFNRSSRQVEGSQVQFNIGRPLFSLRTRLSWLATLYYVDDIARSWRGADIVTRQFGDEKVPDIFTRRNLIGNLALTYSSGVRNKINLTIGMRAVQNRYELPAEFPPVSEAARAAYLDTLPLSEIWAGPVISFDLFTTNYVRLRNIESFALSEDFRLGPHLNIEVHFASHVFGPPSDFVEAYATFNHMTLQRDNLLDYGFAGGARVQPSRAQAAGYTSPLVNESASAYIREVTPRFGPFRLFLVGMLQIHARDLNHTRLTLGSDNGLRGVAPRALQGNNLYRLNAELRSLALNFWSIHVGGVLFYDAGDAPAGWNQYDRNGVFLRAGLHQDAGVGLRVLIPQFNRDVLRLDLAFPFETTAGGYVPRFSAEFNQAF